MKVIKRIVNYGFTPEVDIYLLADHEFLVHAKKHANYRNTFEKKEHEHPMEIIKVPWSLFDISTQDLENTFWIFKRENDNVEEILVLKEAHRMKLSELQSSAPTAKKEME